MRTLGIDIGSFSIKVAELQTSSQGAILKDFFELELPHDLSEDLRFQTLEKLKKIISHYDPRKSRIVVGLGMEHVTTRTLEFPFLDRRKIWQSLPFELEDNVPFSQDEAVFDFRPITIQDKKSEVLAAASPKKYIQEILQLCEDAGFDPDVVAPDGISLANLYASDGGPSDPQLPFSQAEIYVHLGYRKTIINILRAGRLLASRSVFFGGFDLASGLSKAYELPHLDALKALNEKAFVLTTNEGADSNQVAFSKVMTTGLNILVTEIKRVLIDLKATHQLQFKAGFISGGNSGIINLGPFLTQELGIPIIIKNPPPFSHNTLPYTASFGMSDKANKIASVSIGLALEGARKPAASGLNFRKNEFSKQSQNFKLFFEKNREVLRGAAFVFVAFFAYSIFRGSFVQDNIDRLDLAMNEQVKTNTIGLTKANTKTEALKKFVKNKKSELDGRKEVLKLNQMNSALDVLKSISSALPSKEQIKLDVKSFQVTEDRVALSGSVANVNEFNLLQRRITQTPSVTNYKAAPSQTEAGKYGFQVTFNMKRNKAQP